MRGISFNAVAVDPALQARLNANHIEELAVVPHTVMVTALQPGEKWLRMDANYTSQMQQRFDILQKHLPKVIERVDEPEVQAAERELCARVVDYLVSDWPDFFRRKGNVVSTPLTGVAVDLDVAHPMQALSVLHNTDFLLMMPSERIERDGEKQDVYRLKSGALLFPNDWSLRSHFNQPEPDANAAEHDAWQQEQKSSQTKARLGKSVVEIHRGIVSHYEIYFESKVNRMFNIMAPNRIVWRRNWGLPLTDYLFLHADVPSPAQPPEMSPDNLLQHGHIRSEHETFVRLPESRAIVFGIQTYVWPLRDVMANPIAYAALVTGHANLSEQMRDYRKAGMAALDVVLANRPKPAASAGPA